jgi:hypothetical protein
MRHARDAVTKFEVEFEVEIEVAISAPPAA